MSTGEPSPAGNKPSRISSIDQLRGYTILGMILVNYLSHFKGLPWALSHHREGFSYADTIAPSFLFIVGIGFNLSFNRKVLNRGLGAARREALKRYLLITLIGIVVYGPHNWHGWWNALVDIGLAGLLAIPFMHRSGRVRVLAACGYLVLFQVMFSWTRYGPYLSEHSFDGGPLGPLSWVFCLLLGSLVWDWLAKGKKEAVFWNSILWGTGLTAAGMILEMEWPGIKAQWPFSHRCMTMPFTLLSTGLAFFVFLLFQCLDRFSIRLTVLNMFGMNPLALYVFHLLLVEIFHFFLPREMPLVWILASLSLFFLICYALAWRLWRDRIVIKI